MTDAERCRKVTRMPDGMRRCVFNVGHSGCCMFPLINEDDSTFHDPPASEPTPDEDTANFTMPAMITEAECNRRIEEAEHEVELDMQAFEDIWVRQVALAKREQMEADCRAMCRFCKDGDKNYIPQVVKRWGRWVHESPSLQRSTDCGAAGIRIAWEKEHHSEGRDPR